MRKLDGRQFLQRFQQKGEGHYASLLRLSRMSGLGLKTIYRACVHQLRVTPESVDALQKLSDLPLDRDSFLSAPIGQPHGPRGRKPKAACVESNDASAKAAS